ncbi:MAG TPA: tRNA threonylcarbamoyladenosine dehydratase [Flavobacteriaceae bacterium]|nr:tRNA threonylcarbamoyladenosine dehydratase [Flavobacteriaceae bacterium]
MRTENNNSIMWLERSELIFGKEAMDSLHESHVLIVGLGGVGSFSAEFIARAGVGTMTIIDGDVFDITNKNRQLMAMDSTIGKYKSEVLAEKLLDINPDLKLNVLTEFVEPERVWEILKEYKPDYVMDCIDTISPKVEWIIASIRLKIKVISHFGAGGKKDASKVQVARLHRTYNCKLAQHIKKRLKKRGVSFERVRAVFSSEMQDKDSLAMTDGTGYKRSYYGTTSYIPALFGLQGAAEVIRHLTEVKLAQQQKAAESKVIENSEA